MFLITNRHVDAGAQGTEKLGKRPNQKGNNELRVAQASRSGRGFRLEILEDEIDRAEAREYIEEFALDLDPDAQHYCSLRVACQLFRKLQEEKRNLLFFVHGYNNNVGDVLNTAFTLEERYGVEVLPFTWPANGGGVHGKASYLSDKRDARASAGALERTLGLMHHYLHLITAPIRCEMKDRAENKHPNNAEKRDSLFARLVDDRCTISVNGLFHSMGNYLYKQMLKSSITGGNHLLFDNVVLCQADTNNEGHAEWVDRIRHNKRVLITINENDYALRLSRMKTGDAQKARLGHFIKRLDSDIANYVDLTDASWVQKSHSPFGEPAARNARLERFFEHAFSGRITDHLLTLRTSPNVYALK
jgi:esterase/lipase superfamily enzyme